MAAWSVPRLWDGETAFIIAGGPSVATQDLSLIRGRRVIAINSAIEAFADAEFLFFGDARWWRAHQAEVKAFRGRAVTCSFVDLAHVAHLNRRNPPGLIRDPTCLTMRLTSLTGAINLACHLGAATIVLIGADGKASADGRTHHHAPHPWPQRANCWQIQHAELKTTLEPLQARGVRVVNASPGSAWADLWPVTTLAQAVAELDGQKLAA